MSWLTDIARPEIRTLQAYAHADWEPGLVRLHANELPWRSEVDHSIAGLNVYPEPHPHALMHRLAELYGVPQGWAQACRGSDEAIDLLIRCYCRAGQDAVLVCPPTFGMYGVAARIQGARVLEVPLRRAADFALDLAGIDAALAQDPRLLFFCSPNNPTGNLLDLTALLALARRLEGRALVVVDEAYLEFSGVDSLSRRLQDYPALVVLRTLSKAHGLAGARCGTLLAQPEIVSMLQRVIQPYAIAQLSIEAVFAALAPGPLAATAGRLEVLRAERERLRAALQAHPQVVRINPSAANFLLVEFRDAATVLASAHQARFLLRDFSRSPGLGNCLRITIGTPQQNDQLLACLP
ncbi:MAG TPA: histidinol-phosphate transaminase [Steroidobacteraceae bacterium]|nr:histidinol-phosphate transaminase [Steroidobacteraceae bacterium]